MVTSTVTKGSDTPSTSSNSKKRWSRLLFIVLIPVFFVGVSLPLLYLFKVDPRRLENLQEDLHIAFFISGDKKEIDRLETNPIQRMKLGKFGVEKSSSVSEGNKDIKSFLVSGMVTEVSDDWIILDTNLRQFKLLKGENAVCFDEIPTHSSDMVGKEVDCLKENIPIKSYGTAQVEIKEGEQWSKYSYFIFIKPELFTEEKIIKK